MNYNKLLLIITFLLLAISLWGQDFDLKYRRNGTVNTFTTESVTSDYGRRGLDTSPWHKGIDYGGQAGDQLLPLVSGTVKDIRYNEGTMYKAVIIDGVESNDFGWGHIFNNDPVELGILSGNIVFKTIDGYTNRYAIINITANKAFGKSENVGQTVTYNQIPYTVTDQITENDLTNEIAIAPMGDSGNYGDDPYPVHLHLYLFKNIQLTDPITTNNCANPLELINHDEPIYNVCFDENTINYGDQLSSIKIKVEMIGENSGLTYQNSVMDVEQVEIFIKKQTDSEFDLKMING